MDPLSISASIAGLLSLCIQIGQTVGKLADALENVDNTISSFRGEITALSGILQSIGTAFSDPKRQRVLEEARHGTGHIGEYWKGVVVALDHCEGTLRKMSRVLDGIQTSRRTRIFRSFGKHLKLTSEEGVLTLYRQEVQSHTANLQISLQMISVCLSIATDDVTADTSVRLDDLSDDVRNIYRLLDRTKKDLPEPQPNDTYTISLISSSQTVVEDLQQCLGAAEQLISDASTLAEKRSVIGSAIAATEYLNPTQRRRVQDWIDAPTADALSEASSANTNKTPLDARSTISTHAISPLVDRFKPGLSVHGEASEDDDALSETSDIDSGFKSNLYKSGLEYLEKKDYVRAERFFKKAALVSNGNGRPNDAHTSQVKFYLAQTLSRQRRWDEALAHLITLQSLSPMDASLAWLEASVFHELAVVYLGMGFSIKAKANAKAASSKRKKVHGKTHPKFYESIGLLADICDSQNDPEDAEGYRGFIPRDVRKTYTRLGRTHAGDRLDEKEVIAATFEDDEDLLGPLSPTASLPSTSISRSASMMSSLMSQSVATPATEHSEFTVPKIGRRSNSDSYIPSSYVPPRINTFELDTSENVANTASIGTVPTEELSPVGAVGPDLFSSALSQTTTLKEFLEVFRKVGQYQMLGWKDKATKTAIAYYKTFSDSGKYKLISRYLDEIAWRGLERNISEGLLSLASTGQGFSGLHFFALLGVPYVVAWLLERKADVAATATRIFGYTLASDERKRSKFSGLARSLSRSSLGSINVGLDWTPLHFAAAYSGDPETIRLLIDRAAPLEAKAGKGYTPLLLATRKAALDMERYLDHSTDLAAIEVLIANGAKVDAVDDDGLGVTAHANCMKEGDLSSYLLGLTVS